MIRPARKRLETLIAGDCEKADKLRQHPADRISFRIVSFSEPELLEGKSDHGRVTRKAEIEHDGRKQIVEESFSVEPAEGQPGRWEID